MASGSTIKKIILKIIEGSNYQFVTGYSIRDFATRLKCQVANHLLIRLYGALIVLQTPDLIIGDTIN